MKPLIYYISKTHPGYILDEKEKNNLLELDKEYGRVF